jgi:rRNA maturation endonuclease Nob1
MPRSYYDDNYGYYDIDSQEDIDFYFETQKNSVRKKCKGCGRTVKLRRDYAYCNSCATTLERGGDLEY